MFNQFTLMSRPTLFTHDPGKLHEVREVSANVCPLTPQMFLSREHFNHNQIFFFYLTKIQFRSKHCLNMWSLCAAVFQKPCTYSAHNYIVYNYGLSSVVGCHAKHKNNCQSIRQKTIVKEGNQVFHRRISVPTLGSLSFGPCWHATEGLLSVWLSGCLQSFLLYNYNAAPPLQFLV